MRMADTTEKPITKRTAVAMARVYMKKETILQIRDLPKGDAISCAKIAGIMAAKKVPSLIPMCHPLEITSVSVDIELGDAVSIKSTVSCMGRTGVEMEALTSAAVSALTIYDMCKPIDKEMVISDIRLLEKTGGKSGNKSYIHIKKERD